MTTKPSFNSFGSFFDDVFEKGLTNFLGDHFPAGSILHKVPVNISESDSAYQIHVSAPGLNKSDFKIKVDKQLLTISFEKSEEKKEEEKGKWIRNEFSTQSFSRSFTLNDKVDSSKISAQYTDGILVIDLPKKEVSEPTQVEISVN